MMRNRFTKLFFLPLLLAIVFLNTGAKSAFSDDLDPFDRLFGNQQEEIIPESEKSSEELVGDASRLFQDERPLDARTKLLSALKKDPKNYRAMMLLSGYYMQHVGHFKLSLRYILQAMDLFEEKNGSPPYSDFITRAEHMQLLYILSQARLNLDDYQGSLDVLDTFKGFGYYDEWYPGSRSWVLMKLGRLDEAVKIAKVAALAGVEQGRILNMLGILLSMRNERIESLEVFKQAIAFELGLGKQGQPATPLNNSAEVLKELFEDSRAETAWLKTLRLPDGCDHVLPALNLALLAIEGGNYKEAKQALSSFEQCNAQFPLRNGEEYRALVALARGRIALRSGRPEEAVTLLEEAQRSRQWFGKIGTDEEDMQAATLQSLSQALSAHAHWLLATPTESWTVMLQNFATAKSEQVRSWWLRRRASKQLAGTMRDFEDFEIRFTDSLLEYSTLGELIKTFPPAAVSKKITQLAVIDDRTQARAYYLEYLGESQLAHGQAGDASESLEQAAAALRSEADLALKIHIKTLQLSLLEPGSPEYLDLALAIFRENPSWLKNSGLALPVTINASTSAAIKQILQGGFIQDPQSPLVLTQFQDGTARLEDPLTHRLVIAKSIAELADNVFRLEDK